MCVRVEGALCTLDDGGDGEGAAHGGVLLAGDTGERLALRVCWLAVAGANVAHARGHTEALMSDWENMTACV